MIYFLIMLIILIVVFIKNFKKLFNKRLTRDYIFLSLTNLVAIGLLYIIMFKVFETNPLDKISPLIEPLNNIINKIINYKE